jgi:AcrR family transcriptional regulator
MLSDWSEILINILNLEKKGVVTRTFRRLDPERQQVVINAILDEAIEKGPASINIKQVAKRADVSIGSLYQYFGNRENLISFTTSLCVCILTDSFVQFKPVLAAMPLREALEAYLSGGIEWGKTMRGLVHYFGRAAYQGDPDLAEKVVQPVAVAMRETMLYILEAARDRGDIRYNLDLEVTVRWINMSVIALGDSQIFPFLNMYYQVSDSDVSYEVTLKSFLDVLIKGLQ